LSPEYYRILKQVSDVHDIYESFPSALKTVFPQACGLLSILSRFKLHPKP